MKKIFDGPEKALEFLAEERASYDSIKEQQEDLVNFAHTTLTSNGAYVASIHGLYGGTPGMIGSAKRGERYIQGTEPVAVSGLMLALRHGVSEKDPSVYLVRTSDQTGDYLPKPPFPNHIVSEMKGRMNLPGIPASEIRPRHIEAVRWLVEAVAEGTTPLPAEALNRLHGTLPRVRTYGPVALENGQVVNLREHKLVLF